jgi:hypothetical protein
MRRVGVTCARAVRRRAARKRANASLGARCLPGFGAHDTNTEFSMYKHLSLARAFTHSQSLSPLSLAGIFL